jgi:hypothetical protein
MEKGMRINIDRTNANGIWGKINSTITNQGNIN